MPMLGFETNVLPIVGRLYLAGTPGIAPDVGGHLGETATVCGVAASAKFEAYARSQPTLLDLGSHLRTRFLSLVIYGENRSKFGTPRPRSAAAEIVPNRPRPIDPLIERLLWSPEPSPPGGLAAIEPAQRHRSEPSRPAHCSFQPALRSPSSKWA